MLRLESLKFRLMLVNTVPELLFDSLAMLLLLLQHHQHVLVLGREVAVLGLKPIRSKYKVRESNNSFESGCNFQKKDQIDLIGIFSAES